MKFIKVLRITILFFIVFFGEIAISFSDKSTTEKVFPSEERMPISLRINNNLSAYESMQGLDKQIESFMQKWNIVGASVAVVKDERLIYSKGFGYADLEKQVEVQPKHLFRVASVSKLITAVAVMKLVEDNLLSLNDTVFGTNGILNDEKFSKISDDKVLGITVKNLLNHTSGWTNKKGDPMFQNLKIAQEMNAELPLGIETKTKYVIENRPLDYAPGRKSVYSNFGYALLGLVVEKASGRSYESYVIEQILNPLGIYDMHLGKSLPEERNQNELHYNEIKGEREQLSRFKIGEQKAK